MAVPRSCRAIPAVLLLWACGTGAPTQAAERTPQPAPAARFRDRSVLTHDELNHVSYANAYQAVEALRSNWLHGRGPTALDGSGPVLVYLNNVKLGGVETLRGLSPLEIVYIRYYDPAAAAGRWGRDVANGVIMVSTERR